jgi:GNAT superfamily N-acetyltransferase
MCSASSILGTDPRADRDASLGEVRAAIPADARAIARVHVASWREAYRGLLPDDYLAGLSVEQLTEEWTGILADPSPGHVVVAHLGSRIVGFAHAGPRRDDDVPPPAGELYTIYLVPDVWGGGHGRSLLDGALDRLLGDGYHSVTLWMLSTNDRARRFYLRQGWSQVAGERTQEFGGQLVTDLRLGRTLLPTGPDGQAPAQIFSRPSQ